ncbi:MAG: hypothetical protein OYM47_14990 [Gemmatimonadota bacterium]|nr:hypothetical protein [Gemmatimonadota bacterium]
MYLEDLFWKLYKAQVEADVENVLDGYSLLDSPANWRPYGQNESNFGVVENQQASPIPALIEKITNGIDAILMRACYENEIEPRSDGSPRSIEDALCVFFPDNKNWDLQGARREQAENLQILADGPRKETSLIIYDDGEGQSPEDFEKTFLSLLRGNKNDIHFVQGKYNMGGAGAVAFCGRRRYQLIGSKRFNDHNGKFGFTLVRRHPLTSEEERKKKATWYEYLVMDGDIPSFACQSLDLGLYNRLFYTGTVIKLFSYDLPEGSRSVISRDLNQSINEYLFDPALPVFTIDKPERYPKDRNLQRHLYGLKRRLEEDDSRRYVDQSFSEEIEDADIGRIRVKCYVFNARVDDRSVKETRDTIRREFFKNNMSILFSVHGQVHGHYTSEFITRSLKLPLLKDYLLVHVDCTEVRTEYRNELFMASRDRLKDGDESRRLRQRLSQLLVDGRLKDIHKKRKASITVESKDAEDLVRNITRNLPIRNELAELLGQSFKLHDRRNGRRNEKARKMRQKKQHEPPAFSPQRYPSVFSIDINTRTGEEIPMVRLPMGGSRTISFSTDVEDQYFDRVDDPGELHIGLLGLAPNDEEGGDRPGLPKAVDTVLNVTKSSPHNGTIKVNVKPTKEVKVGDAIELRASLSSPGGPLDQIFMVKISEPKKTPKEQNKGEQPDNRLGLPKLHMVYRESQSGGITWAQLEENGISMDHDVVVYPLVNGESLSDLYINMESSVWLSHRSKLQNEETIAVAEKRYVSAVYFHTLFLYTITKNRRYGVTQANGEDQRAVEITEYIGDLFQTFYAQFLLNFDTQELISALEA